MKISLKDPPIPENAPKMAAIIVDASREISKINLDYSPRSIKIVDEIIEGFRKENDSIESIGTTLFCFGCYVGEVIIRNAGGKWKKGEDTSMNGVINMPLFIEMPNNNILNPIGKVIKRFGNGNIDSLSYFYHVFVDISK